MEVALTFTREPPLGLTGFRRGIDRMMLAEVAWPPSERPHIFVCGPTPLVEAAATALVELGHDPALGENRTLRTYGRVDVARRCMKRRAAHGGNDER